jgi:hypothetical protein
MNDLVIPQVVREAILRNRAYFRDLNVQAQAFNAERRTADPADVQVDIGFVTKGDELGPELQFWRIEDRLPHLFQFVRAHPELFGVRS